MGERKCHPMTCLSRHREEVQTIRDLTPGGDGWSASLSGRFTPPKRPGKRYTVGWVGLVAGLDGCGKSQSLRGFDPRHFQPVAIRYIELSLIPGETRTAYKILIVKTKGNKIIYRYRSRYRAKDNTNISPNVCSEFYSSA